MKQISLIFLGIIFSASFSTAATEQRANFKREELVKELLGSSKDQSDMAIYSDIVSSYQANDAMKLRYHLQSMMKKYPQSSYADNALYLAGRLSMENKNYPQALAHFKTITEKYPRSNRFVTAQFAKAMAYKKMNLSKQAREVFADIKNKYPGSPESLRAQNELKLIK